MSSARCGAPEGLAGPRTAPSRAPTTGRRRCRVWAPSATFTGRRAPPSSCGAGSRRRPQGPLLRPAPGASGHVDGRRELLGTAHDHEGRLSTAARRGNATAGPRSACLIRWCSARSTTDYPWWQAGPPLGHAAAETVTKTRAGVGPAGSPGSARTWGVRRARRRRRTAPTRPRRSRDVPRAPAQKGPKGAF